MPLTNTAILNAKPGEKTVKLFDERGLYLEISPKGGKWWRLKYRIGGKEKRLSLGGYPDVSLKTARERRDDARRLVADGIDPGEQRKATKAAQGDQAGNSFEVVAREWFAKYSVNWVPTHADRTLHRFERDIFPWIGSRPIGEITPPELLKAVRRIENRGALETAHRTLSNCGQIFRYAVATGRAERTRRLTFVELCRPSARSNISRLWLSPRKWARSVVSWPATKARSSFAVLCGWPRWSSCGRVNFAKQSGRTLIWMRKKGAIWSQRPIRHTSYRYRDKRSRSCASCTLSWDAGAKSFQVPEARPDR